MVEIRPKSVLSGFAQINKVLLGHNDTSSEGNDLGNRIEANKSSLGRYYYLFMVLLYGGLRVSEGLSIQPDDINELGQVYVRGSKGSNDRLITCPLAADYLLKWKVNGSMPFAYMDRFGAYRLLKSMGITRTKKGNKNEAVTHIFRDEYVRMNRKLGLTDLELSKTTGHRVAKNVEYYGKD